MRWHKPLVNVFLMQVYPAAVHGHCGKFVCLYARLGRSLEHCCILGAFCRCVCAIFLVCLSFLLLFFNPHLVRSVHALLLALTEMHHFTDKREIAKGLKVHYSPEDYSFLSSQGNEI